MQHYLHCTDMYLHAHGECTLGLWKVSLTPHFQDPAQPPILQYIQDHARSSCSSRDELVGGACNVRTYVYIIYDATKHVWCALNTITIFKEHVAISFISFSSTILKWATLPVSDPKQESELCCILVRIKDLSLVSKSFVLVRVPESLYPEPALASMRGTKRKHTVSL